MLLFPFRTFFYLLKKTAGLFDVICQWSIAGLQASQSVLLVDEIVVVRGQRAQLEDLTLYYSILLASRISREKNKIYC